MTNTTTSFAVSRSIFWGFTLISIQRMNTHCSKLIFTGNDEVDNYNLNPIIHYYQEKKAQEKGKQSNLNTQEKKAHQQFTARGRALFFSSKVFFQLKIFHCFQLQNMFSPNPFTTFSFFFFLQLLLYASNKTLSHSHCTPGGETYHFHFHTRWGDRGVWVQGPVHL